VPVEFALPVFAQVALSLQDRIRAGVYEPGSQLPTEAELTAEFGVSRSTVAKALDALRRDGWIDSQRGRGVFVRGVPADVESERHGLGLFGQGEAEAGRRLVAAGVGRPAARVAVELGLGETDEAVFRRWLAVERDGSPVELVTAWFPTALADGTLLGSDEPMTDGIRQHLQARKRVRVNHLTERVSSRLASAEEVRLLEMPRRGPVLAVLVVAQEAAGKVVTVLDAVLPGDRHELEDTYTLP
jgi:GntR family transcriptional regulator